MARDKTRSRTKTKAGAAPKAKAESVAEVDNGVEAAAALDNEADSVAEVNPELEDDASPDAEAEIVPDAEAKADPDATQDSALDSTDEAEPEPENEIEPDAEEESTPDVDSEPEVDPVLDADSDSGNEVDPEPENDTPSDADAASAADLDSEPEAPVAMDAGSDSVAEADTELENDAASDVEEESTPDVDSEPEVASTLDADSDSGHEVDPEPENGIPSDAEVESTPDVVSEPEVASAPAVASDNLPEAEPEADTAPDAVSESAPLVKTGARIGTETGVGLAAVAGRAPAAMRSFGAPTGSGQKSDRKVALITGASGGIGEAFARKLATDGYALVLVARSDSELNRVAGLVTAEHDLPVATVPIDLTSPDAAAEIEMEFEKRNITPEIVVNNAGFGLNGPVADLDRQRQIEMIDLNVRILTDLSMRFIPAMRERGRGGIINIASTAAYMPGPYMAIYYASKAYVLSFSEALATELKGTGITVTTICPGPTATGFQEAAGMTKAALVKLFPMMSAEDVVELGYQGFRSGKRVVIPGLMNRITAATAPLVSNRILLPIMRMLQGPRS